MSDLEEFRRETLAWLEANCPASMRNAASGLDEQYWGGRNPEISHPDQVVWCERMAERGWTVPEWPPLFEIVFVDGYSLEGKLVEIEVTAERKA